MPKLFVDVGPDGEARVSGDGFKGPVCQQASAFMEEALGKVTDTKKKTEWYLTNHASLKREARMGVDGAKLCG